MQLFVELDWKMLKYGKNEAGDWNFVCVIDKKKYVSTNTLCILHTRNSIVNKEF